MQQMQTLGLSDSTPRTENRLKSLFWPSIKTGSDVDYLGAQGYWICTLVAISSCAFLVCSGTITGAVIAGIVFLFYYGGGVGVRERSHYAAALVLVSFVADQLAPTIWNGWLGGPTVLRVLIAALLLSNLRATWIASHWQPESEEAVLPSRLGETWSDKFVDKWPQWLWPKVRVLYFIFGTCFVLLTAIMVVRRVVILVGKP